MSVVGITHRSHACFGLTVGDARLLLDPFLSGNPLADVTAEQVEADYILVSHGHGDHVGDTVDIVKRTGAMTISNFEIASWLQEQGVERAHPTTTRLT